MKRAKQTLGLFLFYLVSVSVSNVGLFAGSASAATFTVTSTGENDDPHPGDGSCGWPKSSPFYAIYSAVYPCTLRAAIEEVNAQPPGTGPHTINFSIGYGNQTISLTKALPDITKPVVIDGGTQPVYAPNRLSTVAPCSTINRHPCIQLNGSGSLAARLLTLTAGNSTVRWLALYNYYQTGISVRSDDDLIEASYIGTDASGVLGTAAHKLRIGVEVASSPGYSAANTVIRNNVISGNDAWGVLLYGSGVRNNQILGNFIGTTVDGSAALLPFDCNNYPMTGVFIANGASNNVIESNVISGNCNGVVIDATSLSDPSSSTTSLRTFNQVLGNRIGTDAAGAKPVPNQLNGVLINNASSNLVTTTASGTPNQISWNSYGVTVSTTNQQIFAIDNKVLSNYIGSATVEAPWGNHFGVLLYGFVTGTAISGNVVEFNSYGIYVNSVNMPADPTASQHNFVQNNTASFNKYYGIWMNHGTNGNTVQANNAVQNISSYQMTADLGDDNINVSPCANTWINNRFGSASGFGAGCIQ